MLPYGQSPCSFPFRPSTILKCPTDRPVHEIKVTVPSCFSPPRSSSLSSISFASLCHTSRLNTCRRHQSSMAFLICHLSLMRRQPTSIQSFSVHFWVSATLDGGIFRLDNGTPSEPIHSISDEILTLAFKSSDYLFSASFGLDHRAMRTLHAVLDTGAGPSLIRSNTPSDRLVAEPCHFCSSVPAW